MALDRVVQLQKVQDEARELFKKKNHDYGDAFADYDVVGVLVRLGDKVKRCQSISKTGIQLVDGEKLRDTLIDMHNYAAMAIMLLDEKPGNDEYRTCDEDDYDELYDELDEEDLVLEVNEPTIRHVTVTGTLLGKWQIIGDSGTKYDRCQYYDGDKLCNTCNCPSFQWNEKITKSCKHTLNPGKYSPMLIEELLK